MGVDSLADYVVGVLKSREKKSLILTRVTGNRVNINGRPYSYTIAVDMPVRDGDWVYVMLNNSANRAVVLGR